MNKIILILSLLATVNSQAQKTKSQDISLENSKNIYKNALKYNDASTAINSLHSIIVKEGYESNYKDSLAILYFKSNNFISSHLLAKEVLEKKPKNLQLLEIEALSLKQLGATKEAIVAFENLFINSKNKYHGYQLALLQYSLKRLVEAKATIIQTIACEDIKDFELQFQIDEKQSQKIPFNSAVYNLQGIVAYELKEMEIASQAFIRALQLSPEFELAKQNKKAIDIEMSKTQNK